MDPNNKSNVLRSLRNDLSPYLFHYTRGNDPLGNMETILRECCLKTNRKNYICFTEAPVTSYIALLDYMQSKYPLSPMYSQFGIGFSRDILYEQYGARNVIYGSEEERLLIDENLHWRFENMNVKSHDFSWLREWRTHGNIFDFSDFPREHLIIIAPTKVDLFNLTIYDDFEVDFTYQRETRSSKPSLIYIGKREWKGFAMNELRNMSDDFTVSGATNNQTLGFL